MGNEDVEIELLKYLREEHAERGARKERDERRDTVLGRLTDQVTLLDKKFDVQAAQNDARFRGLEARMSAVEADAESTGNFRVDDLKAQLEAAKAKADKLEQSEKAREETEESAKRADGVWWRRQWVQWAGVVVAMMLSGCGGGVSTLLLAKFVGGH